MASEADLSPHVVAEVRAAIDMVELVGEHVRLRRRGRKWEGLCPFHEEKTPSFSIDPEKGLFYCFGCHQGGDAIGFVMRIEKLSFPDAVEQLARRFGVRLPAKSPEARRRLKEREHHRSVLEEAQHWFQEQLRGAAGAVARETLCRRGFEPESWVEYGFGFAPDDWRRLFEQLAHRHPEGVIVDSGLAVRPEGGKPPYDRFRNRITFPIRAVDGSLVAFGGRALGDGEPKYLNSPEGPLFAKRSTLFCIDRARRAMAEAGTVVIVEGYFDCLSLHRVGVCHAVATLGTALTTDHARTLRRLLGDEGRALMCYDADAPGRRAAAAGARVLLEQGVDTAVVVLPAGTDPDDVVRAGGGDAFRALLERPLPLLQFLLADLPEEPQRRRRAGLKLAPLVGAARDPATRRNLLYELSRLVDVPPRDLEEVGRSPAPRPGTAAAPPAPAAASTGDRLLALILLQCSPRWRTRILKLVDPELVASPPIRRLLAAAAELGPVAEDPGVDYARALVTHCGDPELIAIIARLTAEELPEVTEDTIRHQLPMQLRPQAKRRSRVLTRRIADASDAEEEKRLQEEKDHIWRDTERLISEMCSVDGDFEKK